MYIYISMYIYKCITFLVYNTDVVSLYVNLNELFELQIVCTRCGGHDSSTEKVSEGDRGSSRATYSKQHSFEPPSWARALLEQVQ